jgi:primosomal protein N'
MQIFYTIFIKNNIKTMLLVNLAQDKSKISNYLSNTLLFEIEKNLKNNKKVILYLNKR